MAVSWWWREHLIGFDPRGVGHSTPVTCDLPPEYQTNVPPYARTPADVERRAAHRGRDRHPVRPVRIGGEPALHHHREHRT